MMAIRGVIRTMADQGRRTAKAIPRARQARRSRIQARNYLETGNPRISPRKARGNEGAHHAASGSVRPYRQGNKVMPGHSGAPSVRPPDLPNAGPGPAARPNRSAAMRATATRTARGVRRNTGKTLRRGAIGTGAIGAATIYGATRGSSGRNSMYGSSGSQGQYY